MNPHFFTAPFYFAFIWLRVQGSGLSWRLRRLFLEDGILVSQPSPRGEGFVSGIPLSSSNLRPFGAPPSIGRREHPREPLPLEGAAERSEAGLASFFAAKPPPLCLPLEGRRSEGADRALAAGKCARTCVSSRRFTAAAKRLFL